MKGIRNPPANVVRKEKRDLRSVLRAYSLFCLLTVLFGCAIPEPAPEVKEPRIFRARWFDYYQRALWHLQEGRDIKAENDLRQAIRHLDVESWEERTYGVHFTEYFPHRELGILLYRKEEFRSAEAELLRSLSQAESSRAKFYLNRVRRDLIRMEGRDRASPNLFLDQDVEGITTADSSITVSGRATDDLYVSEIRVNGEPIFIELALPEIGFQKPVSLEPGSNTINVVVVDLAGKRAERTLRVEVDRRAPLLMIHNVEPLQDAVHLSATIEDSGELRTVEIAGVDIDVDGGTVYELDRIFPVSDPDKSIEYRITDRLGNELAGRIEVSPTGERQGFLLHRRYAALNSVADHGGVRYTYDTILEPSGWLVLNEGGTPPNILLKDVEDGMTVMLDRYYIEGRVRTAGTLTGLRVNGKELLTRTAREVHFGETFPLYRGKNDFLVEAFDSHENHAEEKLSIKRVVPKSLGLGYRLSVSILPFEYLDGAEQYETDMNTQVTRAFVSPRRFHVLDREVLDAILLERKLSGTDLAEPSTASRIGRLQDADLILNGFSRLYPNPEGVEIVGKIIDARSGEVLFVQDVYTEKPGKEDLRRSAEGLYLKFARHFPLLSGTVAQAKHRRARVNLDYERMGRPGMRFVFYRESDPLVHPVTGKVVGTRTDLLGEGEITDAQDSSVWMRIENRIRGGKISTGDRVIAK
jgi:hypothetical protein